MSDENNINPDNEYTGEDEDEEKLWKSIFIIAAPFLLLASIAVIYTIAGYNIFIFDIPDKTRNKPRPRSSAYNPSAIANAADKPEYDIAVKGDPKQNLSDDQMKSLAEKMVEEIKQTKKEFSTIELNPLASSHPDYNQREIENPLKNHMFFSVLLARGPEPKRSYLVVSRKGAIYWPYTARYFEMIMETEDTSEWDDNAYLKAGCLFIHIASPTSQDGWKVLQSDRDFLSTIKVKALNRQIAIAEKAISYPQVKRANGTVTVEVSSWHWAGGITRKWIITFGKDFTVRMKNLGSHGGGTYGDEEEREPVKKSEENTGGK